MTTAPIEPEVRERWIAHVRPLQRFCAPKLAQLDLRTLTDQELSDAYHAISHEAYQTAYRELRNAPTFVIECPEALAVRPERFGELIQLSQQVESAYRRVLQLFAEKFLLHHGLGTATVEETAETTGLHPAFINKLLREWRAKQTPTPNGDNS